MRRGLERNALGPLCRGLAGQTIDEALKFFGDVAAVSQRLWLLKKVGLSYLTLGQPAPTLSGGESQRLKIAREMAMPSGKHNLYLLDEPTTGLHAEDGATIRTDRVNQRLCEE